MASMEQPAKKQKLADSDAKGQPNAVRTWLAETPLLSVHTARNRVVTVDTTEEPAAAFDKLIKAHILSAPVFDKKAGKYVGLLDLRDLVSFVVMGYDFRAKQRQEQQHHKKAADEKQFKHKQFLDAVLEEGWEGPAAYPTDPAARLSVKYLSGRNRFVPVDSKASLLDVAQLLKHKDVHRVPVVDSDNKLLDIVSQTAVIGFFHNNASKLQGVLSQSLEKLGLGHKPVVSVLETDPAIQVFKLINTKNLFGVAVVDKHGKIVANTSASDIKLFVQNPSYESLDQPVIEWLNTIRRQNIKTTVAPVVVIHAHETLGHCIGKLAATKLHRIFVVDDKLKPVGVVSLRDIIERLVQ